MKEGQAVTLIQSHTWCLGTSGILGDISTSSSPGWIHSDFFVKIGRKMVLVMEWLMGNLFVEVVVDGIGSIGGGSRRESKGIGRCHLIWCHRLLI